MRTLLLAAGIMAMAAPAWAQSRETLCGLLPVQERFAGADYVPGVDVNGKPVVPADVGAQAPGLIDVIKIPVTIDLVQQLGQQLPAGTEMNAPVAMVEILRDGRVVYNGQDLTPQAYALCGKHLPDIEAAAGEPQKVTPPAATPAPKAEAEPAPVAPAQEQEPEDDIIWGEGY